MDPTLPDERPLSGPDCANDVGANFDDGCCEEQARGPGEGDARVMAWARAM